MSEEREEEDEVEARLGRAYRRAGIGLALGALVWLIAVWTTAASERGLLDWIIPIVSLALSIFCFSRYSKSKES